MQQKPGDQLVSTTYQVAPHHRVLRHLMRACGRVLYRSLVRVSLFGFEHIPARGPYLIAINHIYLFEPPFILTFWPLAPEPLGAVEVWRTPGQSVFANLWGGIQIDRDAVDRLALRQVVAGLNSGLVVLIAPEGRLSRQPGLRQGKLGLAYLVEQTGVPVVPVGIVGATRDFISRAFTGKRPSIEMHVGEALTIPPVSTYNLPRKEALKRNTDLVMMAIARLLPPAYRGFYADSFS